MRWLKLFRKAEVVFPTEQIELKQESLERKIFYSSDTCYRVSIGEKEMDEYINSFIRTTLDMLGINDPINFNKAKEDMKIFIEKYISINIKDKDIFINDREAYPYKLIATDSEMTKVEETTTSYEPLQCKEKFFDNKKSIKYEGTCDGIFLVYARKQKGNFSSNTFRAKISVKRKFCCVRFEAYVIEEDINNVLSNIINS